MSIAGVYQSNAKIENRTFNKSVTIESDNVAITEKSVAAAKTGTLTTRTDNNTGVATMAAGHGITDGQRADVYWDGGSRYGMTVGTVATNSVPLDGGTGDNLPAATTAITVKVPEEEAMIFDGDNALGIAAYAGGKGTVVFAESGADALAKEFDAAGGWSWNSESGETNPLAGKDVVKVLLSHGETTAKTMRVAVQY